jgi:hypothetical protein
MLTNIYSISFYQAGVVTHCRRTGSCVIQCKDTKEFIKNRTKERMIGSRNNGAIVVESRTGTIGRQSYQTQFYHFYTYL